ncbi:MAG TPA: 3-ketoacyl-ACP reductase [Phycisphaerae bacterium]|jgi:NAD(P)-dependent dehydrogenase (short-subunit alcohol dehydrogenase family)
MVEQRIALVTGGSRGIGRAISVEVARVGYGVVVNYRTDAGAADETRRRVAELGAPCAVCQADVSIAAQRDHLIDFVLGTFGRMDLLVNNAGIAPPVRTDILHTEEDMFDRLLAINLKATYFMSQLAARAMVRLVEEKKIERPMIVNISSIRAYTAAKNYGEYCVSKAGVRMVTRLFANRLAEYGINVYEVCPGIIETDMTGSEAVRAYYNEKLAAGMAPINRWGTPRDVALAVAAIARGDFPFSTGEVFNVDGGFHLRSL